MEHKTFLDGRVTLYLGDCLDVLDRLPANSVDAVITDPPYHFDTIVARFGKGGSAPAQFGTDGVFARASAGFMGKDWDGGDIAFRPETWAKVLRVLKPGGHLAAFSAPKCVHKMAFGIEAAGFEVRDRIINLLDPDDRVIAFLESLSRAQADALFRLLDQFGGLGEAFWTFGSGFPKNHDVSKAIDKQLGHKREKVTKAGAPSYQRSVGNHRPWMDDLDHKVDSDSPASAASAAWAGWGTALKPAYEPIVIARKPLSESSVARQVLKTGTGAINVDAARVGDDAGRWPANLTHDGAGTVVVHFPGGDAARFFYTAKADQHDRIGTGHPTVKPLDLMQWLARTLTPPGGTILDLFAGSGTTGEAAYREGFNAILIEREPEYQADIARRMENATAGPVARRHAATRAKVARMAKSAPPSADDIADIFGQGGGQASDGGIMAGDGGFGFRRRK
jgi:site-specific DNA-methyltransferase (adenine-specific)